MGCHAAEIGRSLSLWPEDAGVIDSNAGLRCIKKVGQLNVCQDQKRKREKKKDGTLQTGGMAYSFIYCRARAADKDQDNCVKEHC